MKKRSSSPQYHEARPACRAVIADPTGEIAMNRTQVDTIREKGG